MKLIRIICGTSVAAALALALAACDSKPFERGGRAIDRAMERTGDKVKDVLRE